jgi:hypothetical protein
LNGSDEGGWVRSAVGEPQSRTDPPIVAAFWSQDDQNRALVRTSAGLGSQDDPTPARIGITAALVSQDNTNAALVHDPQSLDRRMTPIPHSSAIGGHFWSQDDQNRPLVAIRVN